MTGTYGPGAVVLGKWRIERKIGEGSFGTVYEIRREDFGQVYRAALKVITVPQSEAELKTARQEGMDDESIHGYFYSVVEDIVREFALMSRIKGTTNVVSCEDHEVIPHGDGMGWDILIRMELLTPLLEYAYDHPFSRRDIIRLGIDMCRALELCQKYNIIHRDIKPENIFVSDNGDFKLGDFGIARTVERTMSGLSKKGTYSYMAPEVYRGSEYGFGVDIYSLGIVLYRLLNNNRLPFLPQPPEPITYSQREAALAKRMGGEQAPAPVNAQGRLGEIVLRACAFDPKARYSSPLQMRQELEAIQYGPEDAAFIYPSGDELAIHENQYASRRPQREANVTASSAAPAPEAAAAEKTESIFGGGAPGRSAPPTAAEGFFPPDVGERAGLRIEDATEKTESVFGRGAEEPDAADPASDPAEESAGRPKRSKRRKILIAAAALLCASAAVFLMYHDVFNILSDLRTPPVPDSVQEDLDIMGRFMGHSSLGYSYGPFGKLTGWSVDIRSNDDTELLGRIDYDSAGNRLRAESYDENGALESYTVYQYDSSGNQVRDETYGADGTLESYAVYKYGSDGKQSRDEYYGADGTLTFFLTYEYDGEGNRVRQKNYRADGTLYYMLEYDSSGNNVRDESYDENGTLESYTVYEYDSAGHCVRRESYGADGALWSYTVYEYDSAGNLVRRKDYGADSALNCMVEYDSSGNWVRYEQYDENGALEYYNMWEYDSAGNQVREEEYREDGTLYHVSEYDSSGNRVRDEYYDENGVLEYYYVNEYDSAGNRVRDEGYDANGVLEFYCLCKYDSAGNQVRYESYDANGVLEYYYVNEYDSSGKLVRDEFYGTNGALERCTVYGYDDSGRCVRQKYYDANGILTGYMAVDESGDWIWYDPDGKPQ